VGRLSAFYIQKACPSSLRPPDLTVNLQLDLKIVDGNRDGE